MDRRRIQFTLEQQSFFIKNMDVFNFFFRLVIAKASPQKIKEEERLPDAQLFSYLCKLDKLKVIELLHGDGVSAPRGERDESRWHKA